MLTFNIHTHTHTHTHIYIHIYNQYPSYLWHCKLDHINETRITKLHKKDILIFFFIMNRMKLVKLVYWVR